MDEQYRVAHLHTQEAYEALLSVANSETGTRLDHYSILVKGFLSSNPSDDAIRNYTFYFFDD